MCVFGEKRSYAEMAKTFLTKKRIFCLHLVCFQSKIFYFIYRPLLMDCHGSGVLTKHETLKLLSIIGPLSF